MDEIDELMATCELAGIVLHLSPTGQPLIRGSPNQAMLAAIKRNRDEIIRRLGGQPTMEVPKPRPSLPMMEHPEKCRDCGMRVFAAPGEWAFVMCDYRKCNWRKTR